MAQPHKGPRRQIGVRIPTAEAQAIEQRANSVGMTLTDFVRHLMLRELEHPTIINAQEELPLSKVS